MWGFIFLLSNLYANDTDRAMESVFKAGIKQYNIDDKVNTLKDEYINKDVEKYGGIVYSIIKVTRNRIICV